MGEVMNACVDIQLVRKLLEEIQATEDELEVRDLMKEFIKEASHLYEFHALVNHVSMPDIWNKFFGILRNMTAAEIHLVCLEALRILSRDNINFTRVLTKEMIRVLLQFSNILFEDGIVIDTDYKTVAALKCLYNIIYISPKGLQYIVEFNCVDKVLYRAETNDSKLMSQIKLFDMKVLFLVSALCKDVREKMKKKHGIKHLISRLEYVEDSTNSSLSTPEAQVICEMLKILFNLSLSLTEDDEDNESCLRLVQVLRRLLLLTILNEQMKIELHSNIVNLLSNMSYSTYSYLVPTIKKKETVDEAYRFQKYNVEALFQLLEFLKIRLSNSIGTAEDLAPILTALLRASSGSKIVRKYYRKEILPPLRDFHQRPEQGNSLRSFLCRLLTSPDSLVSELASSFLFVLCKENVSRMVKHTGYGNAAGLLAQRGLLAGGSSEAGTSYSSGSDSDTEEYKQYRDLVNPIVGCCEPRRPNPVANMSDEQKEYEAMELVKKMDALTRQGIVKPCIIGEDGNLKPVEHILELQEVTAQQAHSSTQN